MTADGFFKEVAQKPAFARAGPDTHTLENASSGASWVLVPDDSEGPTYSRCSSSTEREHRKPPA